MGTQKDRAEGLRDSRPGRTWLGGTLVIGASLAVTALAAQLEGAAAALVSCLALVAIVIGAGVVVFGDAVLPAAAVAALGVLFFGATVRDVFPWPATAHHLSAPATQLLWSHAGRTTTTGGKYSRSTTHTVVPLVPADWSPGSPLPLWALDPPQFLQPGPIGALRLSHFRGTSAVEAWEHALEIHHVPRPAAGPSFVELMAEPEAEHALRERRALVVALVLLSLWGLGHPLAWLARRGR